MLSLKEALEARDLAAVRAAIQADPKGSRHAQFVMKAARTAFLPALKLLHKNGSDLNFCYANNRPLFSLMQPNPHHGAGKVEPERVECLEWMLANGADMELLGGWPASRAIVAAAISGSPEYVERVKKAGAKIDGFAAAALGDLKLLGKTLKANPKFTEEHDQGVLTALQCAAGSRLPKAKTFEAAQMLLDAGADPNAKSKSWSHEIDAAYLAAGVNAAIFKLLLERSADPTAAISHAVWGKHYEISEIALGYGADLDKAIANGKPLLNDLIRWGEVQQTKWSLAHGASPNVKDKDGWTAAHQAASRGNLQMMQAVIDAGADLTLRDHKRQTPLDVARAAGRDKLVALLANS